MNWKELADIRKKLSSMSGEEFTVEWKKHLFEFYRQYQPLIETHRIKNCLEIMK